MFCIYEVVSLKSFVTASDSKEVMSKGFLEHMAEPPLNLYLTYLRVSCDIISLLVGNCMVTDGVQFVNNNM
jgi:hypothetical protein